MANDWKSRRIGSLGKVVTGKTPSTKITENFGGAYPFITIPDLDGRREIDSSARTLSERGAKSLKTCLLPPGAVMMSCIATIGRCGITTCPSFTNQQINSLVCGHEADPKFVYYCFTQLRHALEAAGGGGSVYTNVSKSLFENIEIAIPPLPEQKRIAHILGTLDDRIELNRRMNCTLEAMARAIFQSWFVDFDPVRRNTEGGESRPEDVLFPDSFEDTTEGRIPRGWSKTDLGKEADFSFGFAFKSGSFIADGDIRLARGDNVKEGSFHWDSKSRYWPEITPELEGYQLVAGDVLIGMDGSKVGKNWVRVRQCDLPCLLVQRVARIRAKKSIGEHFIWILISDPRFRNHVDAVKTGTSIPHISGGQIKAYDFVRPPSGDDRVFDRFEQLVSPLGAQIDANIEQARTLASLRDKLLPNLLSGKLPAELENFEYV